MLEGLRQLRHILDLLAVECVKDDVAKSVVAHVARVRQHLGEDDHLLAFLRQGHAVVLVDQRPRVLVIALQLGPRMAERDEDEAADYGVLGRRIEAVDARDQPPVRPHLHLDVHLGALPADAHAHRVMPGKPLRDQVQEVDPLIVAQRDGPILPKFDTIQRNDDVVHLEPASRRAQGPNSSDANAACGVLAQAQASPQGLGLQRLDAAHSKGSDAKVLRRRLHAGEELLEHGCRDNVPDIRRVLQVAAGHSDNQPVRTQHGAS
mmetsp:Transcript_65725/g.169145  ORF Transcript_65725/g.169145 Transcript_65725/m.169145 type:complete len:263 (+) Transcript_65725:668-1456(+)